MNEFEGLSIHTAWISIGGQENMDKSLDRPEIRYCLLWWGYYQKIILGNTGLFTHYILL